MRFCPSGRLPAAHTLVDLIEGLVRDNPDRLMGGEVEARFIATIGDVVGIMLLMFGIGLGILCVSFVRSSAELFYYASSE